MKLSILICTIESRWQHFQRLKSILEPQLNEDVEMLYLIDKGIRFGGKSIGFKRNMLLQSATGDYLAYIDDDDRVTNNYVQLQLQACDSGCDCGSLNGIITFNGKRPERFIHSIEYREYFERNRVYYRPPNHLNCIKSEIAKQYSFQDVSMYEDTNWAMEICNAGVLKTEFKIDQIIYFYDYKVNK